MNKDKDPQRIVDSKFLKPVGANASEGRHLSLYGEPAFRSVIADFQQQAAQSPGAIALIIDQSTYTYQQLDEQSNRLAALLVQNGAKAEMLVPVCIERGYEMLVAILGVLKAGAAYVPVDPAYPAERIAYILHDIDAKLLLTTTQTRSVLPVVAHQQVLMLDELSPSLSASPVPVTIKPQHLAYVIYTSGSTGKPKGVMIEHDNVSAFIQWCTKEFNPGKFDVVYASTSICFDLSIFEIFFPLSIGKPVRILENGLHITRFLQADTKVLINTVPIVVDNLLKEQADLSNVSLINMAGEPVPVHLLRQLPTDTIEVRNLYGPTEDTTYSTCYRMYKDQPVLIGKPIDQTYIYLLNDKNEKVGVGETGEICIGGRGLARGYLNLHSLTIEKFIQDPFSANSLSRLYKTGDVGRFLPGGDLEYLGRLDNQVKIRGHRIELGEIEQVMLQTGQVKTAVVVVTDNGSAGKKIAAYYTPEDNTVARLEKELYLQRVKSWQEIYDVEYINSTPQNDDEEFDLAGWKDSFTGDAHSRETMQRWLADIVDVILEDAPKNVLEIGSGTGLIYFQIAGKLDKYIGTDFSPASINHINKRVQKAARTYCQTNLKVCAAHEVTIDPGQQIDTVILNSIVQYFPTRDYMYQVLQKSVAAVGEHGRIIIGDVRDKRSLPLFKARLQLQRIKQPVPLREFNWQVNMAVLQEDELCFDPAFFYQLPQMFPQITRVQIRWKRDTNANELNSYRYNVVLYIGNHKKVDTPVWLDWNNAADRLTIDAAAVSQANMVAVKNVPNKRLAAEKQLQAEMNSPAIENSGQLLNVNNSNSGEYAEVDKLLDTATANGFEIKSYVADDVFNMHLLLHRRPLNCAVDLPAPDFVVTKAALTNSPLLYEVCGLLQKDLKSRLAAQLPAYMVPADYVPVYELPTTPNGKTDRKFLSGIHITNHDSGNTYVAPVNDLQRKLADIWQELLNRETIGIQDSFFDLGGHSLTAVRMITAAQKVANVELTIKDLVLHPTIEKLAKVIQAKQNGAVEHLFKYMVPLKTAGTKAPLYIVCGGGGTVFAFKRFADLLDAAQPVYGFQQPTEYDDIIAFPQTIEGVAKAYIAELLQQNPDGPYALSGHCVGGIIAFEMAKQLRAMGKQVLLVALFDTILPDDESTGEQSFFSRLAEKIRFKVHFEWFLLRNHTRYAIQYKVNSLKSLLRTVHPYKDDNMKMEVYKKLEENLDKANAAYTLTPSEFSLVAFYAKEHYYFMDREKAIDYRRFKIDEATKNRWKRYASSVTIYEVEGEHSTLFDPIHGSNFASLLQQHLNAANP